MEQRLRKLILNMESLGDLLWERANVGVDYQKCVGCTLLGFRIAVQCCSRWLLTNRFQDYHQMINVKESTTDQCRFMNSDNSRRRLTSSE